MIFFLNKENEFLKYISYNVNQFLLMPTKFSGSVLSMFVVTPSQKEGLSFLKESLNKVHAIPINLVYCLEEIKLYTNLSDEQIESWTKNRLYDYIYYAGGVGLPFLIWAIPDIDFFRDAYEVFKNINSMKKEDYILFYIKLYHSVFLPGGISEITIEQINAEMDIEKRKELVYKRQNGIRDAYECLLSYVETIYCTRVYLPHLERYIRPIEDAIESD